MKKVTVGVVLFRDKYLDEMIPSILNQDYPNVEFIFLDQEENKFSAYEYIKKHLPETFQKAKVQKGKNIFHSGGHNAIINQMSGEIYFCCSNDMLYPTDFVSKVVKALEQNPNYTFATCKIMRWDYQNGKTKSNIIDSIGIGINKNHSFYDIGQGQEDNGQFDKQREIFGTSGAFSVFTKKALDSIKYKNEYYDLFLHYKDDVDISYRLQLAGNKGLYIPNTKVYHDRQIGEKTNKALWVKQSSYLGDKIIMLKDYSKKYPLEIRIKSQIYHFLKTCYILLTSPKVYETHKKFKKLLPQILAKKEAMQIKIDPKEIVKLMS